MTRQQRPHERVANSASIIPALNRRGFLRVAGAAGTVAALGVGTMGTAAAVPVGEDDITKQAALDAIDYDLEHPRVYHTPEEVTTARNNVANTDWGARLKDKVLDIAAKKPFMGMSAEELFAARPVVAPDGISYYAFPFRGGNLKKGSQSPVDGSRLDLVGYDQPGKVVDQSGNVFPGTVDGVDLSDDGDGVMVDPSSVPSDWAAADLDGPQRFWFVARYNGLVTKSWARWVNAYAYAYVLTGEQKYAEVVATILDALGESIPTSFDYVVDEGPYPWFDEEPRRKPATLYRNMYSFSRVLQKFVNAADLIWNSGELDADSRVHDDMTIEENVAENVVVWGTDWVWRDMFGGFPEKHLTHANYSAIYHNGTVDMNKGLVAGSSLLGLDVGYAEWALDGQVSLQNFLANTIFRDGSYYETSSLYSVSYQEWAQLAYHLRNANYPEGLDLYADPRFINLNVTGPRRQSVAGRIPVYGDVSGVDLGVDSTPLRGDFGSVLRFYGRAGDDATRTGYAQTLAEIAGGDPNDELSNLGVTAYRTEEQMWPLFNIDGGIEGYDLSDLAVERRDSELLEGKGMAMLRSDAGIDRGAVMRYGSTLSHGHYDELGLWLYGGGRDLTYDPGQKPKDDFRASFLLQTVAHGTAVVNEMSSVPAGDDGASVELFADREGYTVAEVSNPEAYGDEGVDEYRRLTAFVDTDDDHSYLFDVFRVAGANSVDFSFHGKGTDFSTSLDLSDPAEGSVAGPDIFWGDKVDSSGNVDGYGDVGRANVPPGNGYGFLGQPRSAAGDETWSATWTVEDTPLASLRLTMLPDDDREVVVADAPDLLVDTLGKNPEDTSLQYLLARDGGTAQFASVIEPVGDSFPVASVEPIETGKTKVTFAPVAAKVTLADGRIDYFLSSVTGNKFKADLGHGSHIQTDAAFAMVRTDENGEVLTARMEGGTELKAKFGGGRPMMLKGANAAHEGSVVAIDEEGSAIHVDTSLPTGDTLAGEYLLIDAPGYSHNSPYRIDHAESIEGGSRVVMRDLTIDLSRGTIDGLDGNTVLGPVQFPFTHTEGSGEMTDANEYFDGKRLATADGDVTTVENTSSSYTDLTVADTSGLTEGDSFRVLDVSAGDTVTLPSSVEIRRNGDDYEVSTNGDVKFKAPE